jgi:hypothetical protein
MKLYFLWKRTPHGSIRVSSDGLSGFFDRILSGKSKCRGLSLAEGENASVTLVLFSEFPAAETAGVEERLAAIAEPLGFEARVIWAERGAPETEWCEALSSLCQSPWAWMLLSAILAVIVMAGLSGLFWTFFWGTAAWFTSKTLISFLIRKRTETPAARK